MESILEAVALRCLTGPLSPPRIPVQTSVKRLAAPIRSPKSSPSRCHPVRPMARGAHVIADGGHTAT
jgi:hypothetical protein